MNYVEIATQEELDRLADGDIGLLRAGRFLARGSAHVVARGSAHVVAWESAHVEAWESAHVEARGSAHVEARGSAHVEAWESAHVEAWESAHVEAWGSAHVVAWESAHVVARGSAHVVARGSAHVVAWESAHVVARGSAHVEASQYVAIHRHGSRPVVIGGTVIDVRLPTNPIEWAAFYGARLEGHVLTVYKAVRDDYRSAHGFLYQPGTTVEASDWDGGDAECGGGLHFSPHPAMALEFDSQATRFLACPVALVDTRAPQDSDVYPQKIKARRTCGPVFEVDRQGRPLQAPAVLA